MVCASNIWPSYTSIKPPPTYINTCMTSQLQTTSAITSVNSFACQKPDTSGARVTFCPLTPA